MSHLDIDTTGWVRCGSPGCTWLLDPGFPTCPDHSDGPPIDYATLDDPEVVADTKRLARHSQEATDDR